MSIEEKDTTVRVEDAAKDRTGYGPPDDPEESRMTLQAYLALAVRPLELEVADRSLIRGRLSLRNTSPTFSHCSCRRQSYHTSTPT